MKLTREIKTAILVIASILLFIWGYSFLKGKDLFTNYKTLYVEYDNVEDLSASAPVTLNGLTIGKVSKITINETTGKLLVELQLKTDFPISKTSKASLYSPSLIGGKQIKILPNFADKDLAVDGQTLASSVELGLTDSLGGKIEPIQQKLEKMLVNIDNLVSGLNNVLDKKGQEDIKKSLAELSQTMEQFHKASGSINSILDTNKGQINGVVTNFNKMSSNFNKISDSLSKADLGKTVRNLNQTLAKVDVLMSNLNSGKGTAGKLLSDDALYNNLAKTSKELELLLQDVRLYPTRYVNVSLFGKKNKPYVAPTEDANTTTKN
ncbi:MlaD family protein [Flavobacterium hibernum]|uniref:Organic solvent ABC transporter substrate-binding protein n=1 Tax=Flavobacterium hibernum TaxID=37752 RepID=A0A0D0EXX3_9FLAO|nr:MlaD family protein [Flavobacterium hibernum]KIO52096.1 organic solvent ABC transporter substrate-binding protein [Flavobacterium hibernum]OXA84137.1 organic solvent ABC transporter substrate-binding protein [Flavobacterium hibernum]PTS93537.1 MCE family protein [Flavobacterium sp. HMWF030]STO11050.1 Probable phospholipid ABC transporter-binding protein mlaD [Flavobacterium hibernum]